MNFNQPQRQPVIALLITAIRITRIVTGVVWPLLLAFIFRSKKNNALFWLIASAAILLFIVARTILDFLYFRFSVQAGQLVIFKGIISKKNSTIPLERIQAVHLEQSLLHTLTGTYRVLIDTAGSEKAEVTIYALKMQDAVALKELILRHAVGAELVVAETPASEKPVIRLGWRDLARLSLSANHIETLALIAAFTFSFLDDIKPVIKTDAFNWLEQYSNELQYTWQVITALTVFMLMVAVVASCIRTIFRFYHFTMTVKHNGFNIKWGLIEIKQKMIPFSKVQVLNWRAGFLRRILGLYILQLKITGEDEVKKKQKILVPVTQKAQLQEIVPYYQPQQPSATGNGRPIQLAYLWRRVLIIGLPVTAVVTIAGFIWLQWVGLWPLVWLVYFTISSFVARRNFLFWVNTEALQLVRGVWGREHIVLNWNNIQFVSIRQSLYQKKHGLANLVFNTAGGRVVLPYLRFSEAKYLVDYALKKIESSHKNWM